MKKWKKFLSVILSAAMVLGSQSIAAVGVAADTGAITPIAITPSGTTYNVTSAGNLQWIADEVNLRGNSFSEKTIILKNDIDLGGAEWTPIGVGHFPGAVHTDPDEAFKGTFNGNYHTISNFKVSKTDAEKTANASATHTKKAGTNDYDHNLSCDNHSKGFFGLVDGSTIKNLKIDNATIDGWNAEAAVVGTMLSGIISNVDVVNSSINGDYENAGAIVGRGGEIQIENCCVGNCTITLPTEKDYQNGAGALAGRTQNNVTRLTDNQIDSCRIAAYRKASGLVGYVLQPTEVTMTENEISDTTVTINSEAKNKTADPYFGILFAEIQGRTDNANRCYENISDYSSFKYSTAVTNDFGSFEVPAPPASGQMDVRADSGVLTINKFLQINKQPIVESLTGKQYYSLQMAVDSAKNGETLTLLTNDGGYLFAPTAKNLVINLNKKTYAMMNSSGITIEDGKNLTIQNGTMQARHLPNGITTNFYVKSGSSVTLDAVVYYTDGMVLYPSGDAAHVTVRNSTLNCGTYAVATNAASADNYKVIIDLSDSSFISEHGYQNDDNDSCPVMINIPGTLNMTNCTVNGTRQGVLVRGGTATIKNSNITLNPKYTAGKDKYLSADWGNGDEVPMAALVVGNRNNGYNYPATCTLENTKVSTTDSAYKAIYTYAMNNTTRAAALNISGENSYVSGEIVKGNNPAAISIDGGYYTNDPISFLKDGYKASSGNWSIDGKPYGYKVSVKPVNVIESVTGKAYSTSAGNDIEDTSTQIAVSVSGNIISVVGMIPEADSKVILTCMLTDGTLVSKEITKMVTGNFSSPDPFAVTGGSGAQYTIDVSQLSVQPAKVAIQEAAPTAIAALQSKATDEQKTAATEVTNAITTNPTEVKSDGLDAAVTTKIETKTEGQTTIGGVVDKSGDVITAADPATTKALSDAEIDTTGGKEVVIVAQPYLDIKVTDVTVKTVNSQQKVTVLKLEIEPMYNIVAVVKNTGEAVPKINTSDGGSKNAAVLKSAQPMTVTTAVKVSIPLPENLEIDSDNFYVQHDHKNTDGDVKTYYYKATVTRATVQTPRIATFTVPNGFSSFTFKTDARKGTIDFEGGEAVTYDLSKLGAKFPVITKEGYTFNGWSIKGQIYTELTTGLLTLIDTKQVKATPVFTQNGGGTVVIATQKVSFDANGGKGTMDAVTATAGAVNLPEVAFTNDGFKFIGWNTAKDGKGAAYTNGESITGLTADVTLYAQWAELPKTEGKLVAFSGKNRYDTMKMLVSRDEFQIGGTAILTTGANYADALAAAGLAGLKEAPIILTNPKSLSTQAASMLQMIKPKTVFILGNTNAVSADAENAVKTMFPTATITREDGKNRFETALKIYAAGSGWGKQAIIIDGQNYADALSVAPYAYAAKCPVFLSHEKTGLDDATLAAIKAGGFTSAVVMGSEKAVPANVEKQLGGISALRFAGSNRYDTCSKFAVWATGGTKETIQPAAAMNYGQPSVTTGANFADALAGAAYCGNRMSVMLLVSDSNMTCITSNLKTNKADVKEVSILGSTTAVSEKARTAIKTAIG